MEVIFLPLMEVICLSLFLLLLLLTAFFSVRVFSSSLPSFSARVFSFSLPSFSVRVFSSSLPFSSARVFSSSLPYLSLFLLLLSFYPFLFPLSLPFWLFHTVGAVMHFTHAFSIWCFSGFYFFGFMVVFFPLQRFNGEGQIGTRCLGFVLFLLWW